MSEMVERVAKAIWNVRREEEDRCDMELEDMGKGHSVWTEARAAILAMSDPTPEMTAAISMGINADQVWRSMIQAALKEQE